MAPKKQTPPPPEPADATSQLGEEDERPLPWVYGVNDHIDTPKELPSEFQPTGVIAADFRRLCKVFGASPHPAFKERPGREKRMISRRPSLLSQHGPDDEAKESPVLSIRSILLDSMTMNLFSLLLPHATRLKVLCFSDCRLDSEMLGLLRDGLQGDCSVEALQIEWNPFELPLQALPAEGGVEDRRTSLASGRAPSEGAGGAEPSGAAAADALCPVEDLEHRERLRYLAQSHRHLRCFREHVEARFGGQLESAWGRLMGASVDADALMNAGDFHDMLEARLGISGPQVAEVFEVLDGPDYAAGQGRISLRELQAALESLPEAPEDPDRNDPIGLALAAFMDADSNLESLSLRACSIGRLELGPISAALQNCPWQLRCLNLWDNRVCDRGAALLGAALMPYRGLEYLGLGKNRLTQAGMSSVVKPFQIEVFGEARYQEIMDEKAQQEGGGKADPKGKAKAKPKAKPEARRDSQGTARRASMAKSGRCKREATKTEEEIEEVPGDPPTYILRRPCELRTLTLSENPISGAEVVEALQPHGPRGAELVLRGTPAAAQLIAKRPELAVKVLRPPAGLAGPLPGSNLGSAPSGDGWVLRVA